MSDELMLYGYAGSSYVRTACMVCEEKGVPYKLEQVGHDEIKQAKLHPFVKMPALRHGDLQLYETLAIAQYVDGKFGGPALQPVDPAERARMFQWISAVNDYFYPDAIKRYVLTLKYGDPTREQLERAERDVVHHFGVLNQALQEAGGGARFLVGGKLTLADLFVAPIHYYVQLMPRGPELLIDFPALAAYGQSMAQRDSFRNTHPV